MQNTVSALTIYKSLISLRQKEHSLMVGAYTPVWSDHQMISYIRHAEGHPAFLIVLNLTHRPCYFKPGNILFKGTIVIDTVPEQLNLSVHNKIDLSGDEGLVVRLDEWQSVSSILAHDVSPTS
jgi:alpha-glucosidase